MKEKIINIPNFLTTIRLILAIVFVFLVAESKITLAIIVVLLAIVTDLLDGYFARKLKQVSQFGRLFDSTVDASAFLMALVVLSFFDYIEPTIAALIIFAGILRAIGYSIQKKITPDYWSKVSFLIVNILIILSLLHQPIYNLLKWPAVINHALVGCTGLYKAVKSYRKL